jgi:purine-binding chemotaxis protein CheW
MSTVNSKPALMFRAGARTYALDLLHVLEIMRPLPIDAIANAPDFVPGLSMIRGEPTPVVSLASLLTGSGAPPSRFVVVRAGQRRVALAVDEVLGVFELDPATLHGMPPLVQNAAAGAVDAISALDAQLLFVLHSGNLVPDGVWQETALQP